MAMREMEFDVYYDFGFPGHQLIKVAGQSAWLAAL